MSNPYREVLRKTIAVLLTEVGYSSASQIVIETLVEMLQSCKRKFCIISFKIKQHFCSISVLVSISQSTRDYAELARRTEPTMGDVVLALASNGIDFDELKVCKYWKIIYFHVLSLNS